MKSKTVETILRQHRRNGYAIENKYRHNGKKLGPIFETLAKILKDKAVLKQWAGLSMVQRARNLRFEFNIKVKPATLRTYYRRLGIRYLKIQGCNERKLKLGNSLRTQQYDFCSRLYAAMQSTKDIVYIDETSFHMWSLPSRTWQDP